MSRCEICGIECDSLQVHHLIPQQVSRSSKYSNKLKNDENNFLMVCNACHSQIHALFTNQQLRDMFSSKDELLADEKFAAYVKWRKKHPEFKGSSKMSNSKKRRR